jgi:hypothetical protein
LRRSRTQPLPDIPASDTAFVRDEPADISARDEFAHANYARVLATTLSLAPSPFTAGLFGPWGVGKSSIIRGIRASLPHDTTLVEVDVWRYEGDALRRELLRTLATDLAARGELETSFDPRRDLQDLSVDVQTSRLRLSFSWARLLQLVVVCAALVGIVELALCFHPVQRALQDPKQSDARVLSALTAIGLLVVGLVRSFQSMTRRYVVTSSHRKRAMGRSALQPQHTSTSNLRKFFNVTLCVQQVIPEESRSTRAIPDTIPDRSTC